MRDRSGLACGLALALCSQAAHAAESGWQCSTIGGSAAPAVAQAASDYLGRAERVYPSQLLGVVRSNERVYLVNANDGGWTERVRQGLMELRMAEPDITAKRRFHATATGAANVEIPAGEFVCLAHARAGRHGLALTGRRGMLLAPGRSVHLVDPREPAIVVEVRAAGNEPLDFREILALSGRSGIYAGLTGKRAPPGIAGPASRTPGDAIVVALGPGGRLGEVVMAPRDGGGAGKSEDKPAPAIVTAARATTSPLVAASPVHAVAADTRPPVTVTAAPEQPVQVATPAIAPAPVPAPAVTVVAPQRPVTVAVVVEQPVPVAAPATVPARSARPASGQSYEEYAKSMKQLMALRRSGGVQSISELTYVHPAIEDLRARPR